MLTKEFVKGLRLAVAIADRVYLDAMTRAYCFSDDETILESELLRRQLARPLLSSGVFETKNGIRVRK